MRHAAAESEQLLSSSLPILRAVADLLSQKTAKRLLEDNGWTEARGGKHVIKMTKPDHRPITLPHHKGQTYSRGLSAAIRKQAGL